MQTVAYDPSEVVVLEIPTGYQTTLQFSSDERIENVAVGDAAAWQATVNRRGDYIFVKSLRQGVQTNMVVVTDARLYTFNLTSGFAVVPTTPFVVRFTYPAPAAAIVDQSQKTAHTAAIEPARARWLLSGSKQLFPASIVSDGGSIVIKWHRDAPIPAVYGIDEAGREQLTNGMTSDHRLLLDANWQTLIFRLDRSEAIAKLEAPER